jgi:hypothetical protein
MSAVAIYQPLGTPAMLRDIHDDLDAPELEAARRSVELQMAAAALGDGIQGKLRYPASRNRSPGRGPESALRWHSSSWCSNSGPGRARDKAPVAGELESLVLPLRSGVSILDGRIPDLMTLSTISGDQTHYDSWTLENRCP